MISDTGQGYWHLEAEISHQAAAALQGFIDQEGVSATEALRRLVGLADYFRIRHEVSPERPRTRWWTLRTKVSVNINGQTREELEAFRLHYGLSPDQDNLLVNTVLQVGDAALQFSQELRQILLQLRQATQNSQCRVLKAVAGILADYEG